MELFCALLTGFFLWLFVYHWRRKSMARLRKLAGELVVKTEIARPWQWRLALFVYLLLCWLWSVDSAVVRDWGSTSLGFHFGIAVLFALVLILGSALRATIAFEVRAKGILCGKRGYSGWAGKPSLTPWNQISAYQWVPKSFGSLGRLDDTHGRFTVGVDAIAAEQEEALTAAIGQFVPVYDHDGTLLAKPEQDRGDLEHVPWQSLDIPRFQFNLQTMLLAVVGVACAASLCGLHYFSPHYQALVKLEAFGPEIHYVKDDVWGLDFSACRNKPTDDDLVNVATFVELKVLDLSGSPITDAGLAHLKGLKNLDSVMLANTGVTSKGMKDLKLALPNVGIGAVRYPSPAVIVAPSAKGP